MTLLVLSFVVVILALMVEGGGNEEFRDGDIVELEVVAGDYGPIAWLGSRREFVRLPEGARASVGQTVRVVLRSTGNFDRAGKPKWRAEPAPCIFPEHWAVDDDEMVLIRRSIDWLGEERGCSEIERRARRQEWFTTHSTTRFRREGEIIYQEVHQKQHLRVELPDDRMGWAPEKREVVASSFRSVVEPPDFPALEILTEQGRWVLDFSNGFVNIAEVAEIIEQLVDEDEREISSESIRVGDSWEFNSEESIWGREVSALKVAHFFGRLKVCAIPHNLEIDLEGLPKRLRAAVRIGAGRIETINLLLDRELFGKLPRRDLDESISGQEMLYTFHWSGVTPAMANILRIVGADPALVRWVEWKAAHRSATLSEGGQSRMMKAFEGGDEATIRFVEAGVERETELLERRRDLVSELGKVSKAPVPTGRWVSVKVEEGEHASRWEEYTERRRREILHNNSERERTLREKLAEIDAELLSLTSLEPE